MTTAPQTPPSPMTVNAVVIRSSAGLEHKTCVDCHLEKPVSEFPRYGGNRAGYRTQCKICKTLEQNQRNKLQTTKARNLAWRRLHWKTDPAYRQRQMARVANWLAARPDYDKKKRLQYRKSLSASYVRKVVADELGIRSAEIPEAFVQLKMKLMALNRLNRKINRNENL